MPSSAPGCVACVHHARVPENRGALAHVCMRESAMRSCIAERMGDGRCGPEGVLFCSRPDR